MLDLAVDSHSAGSKKSAGLADAKEGLVLDEFLVEGLYLGYEGSDLLQLRFPCSILVGFLSTFVSTELCGSCPGDELLAT